MLRRHYTEFVGAWSCNPKPLTPSHQTFEAYRLAVPRRCWLGRARWDLRPTRGSEAYLPGRAGSCRIP